MDQIAQGDAVWQSNRTKDSKQKAKGPSATKVKRTKATSKAKTAKKRKRTKAAALNAKASVRRSTRHTSVLPGFIEPCLATLSDKAPDSPNWLHEIKFDGYRLQAHIDHGDVRLLTRKGLDWTAKFATTAKALATLPIETAVIDGELVVEGRDGVSSFSLLQEALKVDAHETMVFYAFDLLHLDGEDLRAAALEERKDALAKLMKRLPKNGPLRLSESIDGKGTELHANACRLGLEGIISKLRDAPYRSGRGADWLKTKCSDRQELVVGGYSPSTADSRAVGALSLGYYDKGELKYAGRCGTGYTHAVARDLYRKLKAIERPTSPFKKLPPEERGKNRPVWVEPKLIAEVNFHGWTHGDIPRVRQASFQGLRQDKAATDVVREEKKALPARTKTAARKSAKVARPASKKNDVNVAGVRLSHPDRIYWDDVDVSKRDLAEYYEKVWKWMRPHVTGRVLALVRCPDGASGQCFFQKHASAGIDPKLLTMVPEPDGDKSIAVDDLPGLISLAQAGALEIHIRGSTIDRLEDANRLVFDLDPGPGVKWSALVDAAREVRERLADIKLKTFVKTTGGKGLHVVLPIKPTPWDEAKAFARALAEAMEQDDPKRFVSTAKKTRRDNRIFVDYLRNSREATAVAPYSTRARPGAPVAVPITWNELSKLPSSNHYTVSNISQRLSRLKKDPWAGIDKLKQKLPRLKNG
jgi:bifunctional non-homologous end joining protein LigD